MKRDATGRRKSGGRWSIDAGMGGSRWWALGTAPYINTVKTVNTAAVSVKPKQCSVVWENTEADL